MLVGELELEGHPRFDPYHVFIQAVPFMVDQARFAAATEAHSYRNFHVGAAGFFIDRETQRSGVLTAGNVKSRKHRAKVCAEKRVLTQGKKNGFLETIGLVVAGTTDAELIEEVTGRATPTIHPCEECRQTFDEDPLMRDDTLVITVGLESDRYQVHTHREMQDLYLAGDKELRLKHTKGFIFNHWEARIANYQQLKWAEAGLPPEEQRTVAKLAHMALSLAVGPAES